MSESQQRRNRELREENDTLRAKVKRLTAVVEELHAAIRLGNKADTLADEADALTATPPAATVLSVEPCLSQQRIDGGPWEAQCVECGHPVCEHVRRAILDATDGGDDE